MSSAEDTEKGMRRNCCNSADGSGWKYIRIRRLEYGCFTRIKAGKRMEVF